MTEPYTTEEIREMLKVSIVGHIQTVDLSKTEAELAASIPNEIIRAAVLTDSRLLVSIVNAISEIIERNNQRLLEVLSDR